MKKAVSILFLILIWTSIAQAPDVTTAEYINEEIPEHEEIIKIPAPTEPPRPRYREEEYTITAYCSCPTCCGKRERPNGKVYGAGKVELISGYHMASPLPFGTKVEIDGKIYECQDRTSSRVAKYYHNKVIDVYFNDHAKADNFGKRKKTIRIMEELP